MNPRVPQESTSQLAASPENVEMEDKAKLLHTQALDLNYCLNGSSCPVFTHMPLMHVPET